MKCMISFSRSFFLFSFLLLCAPTHAQTLSGKYFPSAQSAQFKLEIAEESTGGGINVKLSDASFAEALSGGIRSLLGGGSGNSGNTYAASLEKVNDKDFKNDASGIYIRKVADGQVLMWSRSAGAGMYYKDKKAAKADKKSYGEEALDMKDQLKISDSEKEVNDCSKIIKKVVSARQDAALEKEIRTKFREWNVDGKGEVIKRVKFLAKNFRLYRNDFGRVLCKAIPLVITTEDPAKKICYAYVLSFGYDFDGASYVRKGVFWNPDEYDRKYAIDLEFNRPYTISCDAAK